MDVDCGSFLQTNLELVTSFLSFFVLFVNVFQAVSSGKVTSQAVDTALSHLLAVQMRLGMFDPPQNQPYTKIGIDQINTAAAQQLALRNAQEGIVLLKNQGNALPLSSGGTVAVIGPNAQATTVMQGTFLIFSAPCPDDSRRKLLWNSLCPVNHPSNRYQQVRSS